jgi:hypothetical protein
MMRRALWLVGFFGFAAVVWWLSRPPDAPAATPSMTPAAPVVAPPPAATLLRDGQPSAPPAVARRDDVPLLPPSAVSGELRALCARLDDACRAVPLWTPADFEVSPRVRLVRDGAGARVVAGPGEGKSAWARCVDRVLAGATLQDLPLPAGEVEISCPATTSPRTDALWSDRESFKDTALRCLHGRRPTELDARLDLVVEGDVVEVRDVVVKGDRELDPDDVRCIEQELAATRLHVTPDERPGFDRLEWTFKATGLDAAPARPDVAAFSLGRREALPTNPADAQLARLAQAARDFPDNPYAALRLGEAYARRHANTNDPAALAEARAAYERFLGMARPGDPLVEVINRVLEQK